MLNLTSALRKILSELPEGLGKHGFGLAAFLTPLGIRAVPEIIVGPYPVGFDTIAFYVPEHAGLGGGEGGLHASYECVLFHVAAVHGK